jgi:ASC-1-like (ASCH) protein/predicted acetyltransferase
MQNNNKYKLILDVQEPYLGFIKSRKKVVEGRLAKPKYLDLQKGDRIKINDLEIEVLGIKKYAGFREMLIKEGFKNLIPDAENLEEAINVYYKFYTQEDESKYGVAAISIRVLSKGENEMNVKLIPVKLDEKEILREMIKEYEKELTGLDDPGEYKYLDSYWEKENRHPYFITVDECLAGFILINDHTLVVKPAKNVAEFYVKKDFRRQNTGKTAAFKIFNLFPGKWEIRELKDNVGARHFWNKVVAEYTGNKYQEVILENEQWNGSVQIFDNSRTP